ncbi:Protein of unknown function [Leuconostoc citreum LBAE C11]|nr:Protein of unknown function [Leuconostoc citreum LBAE C10]CCF27235.1 Protein of unknown function [Leuconostoc citreum LBAE C11]
MENSVQYEQQRHQLKRAADHVVYVDQNACHNKSFGLVEILI